MRVLLDECTPRKLRSELPGHIVQTISELGWRGAKNGELLSRAAAAGFDVLLSVDQNIQYQQNLTHLPLSVVLLEAPSNDIDDLRPLMPLVRELLGRLEPNRLYVLS